MAVSFMPLAVDTLGAVGRLEPLDPVVADARVRLPSGGPCSMTCRVRTAHGSVEWSLHCGCGIHSKEGRAVFRIEWTAPFLEARS